MKDYSQLSRIIRILERLSCGHKLTTKMIYDQFERKVPVRTIQRDLFNIEQAGLPLKKKKISGNENEWSLPDYYKNLVPPVFQRNELLSLYFLKSYLKNFGETNISDLTAKLIQRLEQNVPGDIIARVVPNEDIFFNHDSGCYNYEDSSSVENIIIHAILKKEWLDVSYQPSDYPEAKIFSIFPHKLYIYKGGLYVAVSFPESDDYFSILLHFIISAEKSRNRFNRQPAFNQEIFDARRFGVFSGNPVKVKLMIEKDFIRYFINRIWHPSQKIYHNDDESLILEINVPLAPELVTWITGWSNGVTVLEPEELRQTIAERGREILKKYN